MRAHDHISREALVALSLAVAARSGSPVAAQVADDDRPISPAVEAVFTVGVVEGAAWEMFGYVSDVAFDADGTLFILDDLAGHIVVIDSAGEFVRTISRRGDGPGELGQPIALVVFGDGRIGVNDLAKPGLQLFSRDGEFLDAVPFSVAEGMPGSPNLRPAGPQPPLARTYRGLGFHHDWSGRGSADHAVSARRDS